ncbi:MAG: alpha/beta fold hydrolase [Thermoleophilia bacterium]|nr:alpha/beta fold hydrolase [Thermoleophilia bacterium]
MQLNAESWGPADAPPVVCLHGLTGHARRYRRLAEEALPHRRVVALDLRGHGRSTWAPPWGIEQHVADLVEAAAALGLEGAAWIGHSFGGRLVAELAARAPGIVGRAVLLDPALHLAPEVAHARARLAGELPAFASEAAAIAFRLADSSLFTTSRETLAEEMHEHLVESADGLLRYRISPEMAVVAWSEMATPAPPWPACPTLAVLGERSWLSVDVPAREGIRVVRVPGGHSVLWDDFEAAATAIAAFVV